MMALQDPKSDPGIHHRRIVHGSDMRRIGQIPMTMEAVLPQGESSHSEERYRRKQGVAKMAKRLDISEFGRQDLHSQPWLMGEELWRDDGYACLLWLRSGKAACRCGVVDFPSVFLINTSGSASDLQQIRAGVSMIEPSGSSASKRHLQCQQRSPISGVPDCVLIVRYRRAVFSYSPIRVVNRLLKRHSLTGGSEPS
jgi:hypothetical protein